MSDNNSNLASPDKVGMQRTDNKKIYFYNMSFYYQSTIIYFVAFILYVVIRGEFIENSFILITRDPIIYFFAIIVLFSLLSLVYNLYKKRHLEVFSDRISFVTRLKSKTFGKEDILFIKIYRSKNSSKKEAFRFIRIKVKERRRPIIIRPYDYENENELVQSLEQLKLAVESN